MTFWIVFLESDDIITPDYLEEKVNVINNNPNVEFIFNDIETFGERAENCGYEEYFKFQKDVIRKLGNPADYFYALGKNNFVPTLFLQVLLDYSQSCYNCPIKSVALALAIL